MITAEDICKDYQSETGHGWHRVLSGVSFTISRGEKVAVLGRNGAGKSTLIRLIAGVELPTLGTIDRQISRMLSLPVMLPPLQQAVPDHPRLRRGFRPARQVFVGTGAQLFRRHAGPAQLRCVASH